MNGEMVGSRIPPHSLESEQALLGSVMLDPEALEFCSHLHPDAFYRDAHRHVWQAILKVTSRRENPDIVTLVDQLKTDKRLEDVGGIMFVGGLSDTVPTALHAEAYTRVIEEKYVQRQIISAAGRLMGHAYEGQGTLEGLLSEAGGMVETLTVDRSSAGVLSQDAVVSQFLRELEAGTATPSVSTGFGDLDRMLGGGLERGSLTVLAARPSMGKSALMMQIARSAARSAPVAVVSLEMPASQLTERLIAMESGVSALTLRDVKRGRGQLSPENFEKVYAASAELASLPLHYFDDSSLSLERLVRELRTLKRREGLGLVCLDYLQLVSIPRLEHDEVGRVSTISRRMKTLARELDVPVLALSQLSRAVESRDNKRPVLSDLRSSGSIEQDADNVIFLYREAYYHQDKRSSSTGLPLEEAEAIFGKTREGPTGTVPLMWRPNRVKFENAARPQGGKS